ncbi:Phospholipid hydroperoxide glutathione peroxidase [Nymphon striatum]|nr:Phospholipid hydroperoxide glutathione peroxidase [Nymphon striatum]
MASSQPPRITCKCKRSRCKHCMHCSRCGCSCDGLDIVTKLSRVCGGKQPTASRNPRATKFTTHPEEKAEEEEEEEAEDLADFCFEPPPEIQVPERQLRARQVRSQPGRPKSPYVVAHEEALTMKSVREFFKLETNALKNFPSKHLLPSDPEGLQTAIVHELVNGQSNEKKAVDVLVEMQEALPLVSRQRQAILAALSELLTYSQMKHAIEGIGTKSMRTAKRNYRMIMSGIEIPMPVRSIARYCKKKVNTYNILEYNNNSNRQGSYVSLNVLKFHSSPEMSLNVLKNVKAESNLSAATTIYDFKAVDIDGNEVSLEKYSQQGMQMRILCSPAAKGLSIPLKLCMVLEFAPKIHEEPGTNSEIKEFAAKYGVKFDMYSKIDVNGKDTHPLWTFLKEKQKGFLGDNIKWNFTKFIIDKEGKPVKRYSPTTEPNHPAELKDKSFQTIMYFNQIFSNGYKPELEIIRCIYNKNNCGISPIRLQRMLLDVQKYTLNVTYKPGKELILTDMLSHAYLNEEHPGDAETFRTEINLISRLSVSTDKYDLIKNEIDEDPELQALKQIVKNG